MNKFLLSSTLILLVLSGYLGYRVYKLTPRHQEIAKTPSVKTCISLPYDYSNGDFEGIINYETAKNLHDIYNRNKKGIASINDAGAMVPGEDSKNIWFSFDRLKNFMWHVEKQNCENGCADSLGLRIYFGRYPNLQETTEEGLTGVPKTYSNRLTLYMVPTYRNENGKNVDFYPGSANCRTPLASSPTHSTGGDLNLIVHNTHPYIFLFDMGGTSPESQNHGTLIPPGDESGSSFH